MARSAAAVLVVVIITAASLTAAYYLQNRISQPRTPAPVLLSTLTSPNPAKDEYFGTSVAIDGGLVAVADNRNSYITGNTVVNNITAGLANLYLYNASTGAFIRNLESPPVHLSGQHYTSVAVSGDLVAAGAMFFPDNGSFVGHVYVFNASSGALLHTLSSPNSSEGVFFGASASISGDLLATQGSGGVYVFNAETGTLVQEIPNPDSSSGTFGGGLAIDDGVVAVGSPDQSVNGSSNAGAAYVFNATTGALLQRLTSPHPQSGAQMGFEVGISGNVALVSATSQFVSGHFGTYGHVYAFNTETGELLDDFTSPNLNLTTEFGTSVAISGNTAIVGAMGPIAGFAYLFDIKTGSVLGNVTSPSPGTLGTFGGFGSAIATEGGLTVIGAPEEEDGSLVVAGHAYVFHMN